MPSFEEALAAVKSAGITIYVVGIGGVAGISLKGERELKRLADETGGRVFFPPRAEELASVYDQLAADAQNRYLVTYTPTNTARDGGWRAVNLTTTSPALRRADARRLSRRRSRRRSGRRSSSRSTDLTGQYVEISADDLVVSEDGVEQKVDTFTKPTTPASIVLALDASGSMRKTADALMAAARDVRRGAPARRTNCRCCSSRTACWWRTTSAPTARPSLDAIDEYQPVGGTALYDALAAALDDA